MSTRQYRVAPAAKWTPEQTSVRKHFGNFDFFGKSESQHLHSGFATAVRTGGKLGSMVEQRSIVAWLGRANLQAVTMLALTSMRMAMGDVSGLVATRITGI